VKYLRNEKVLKAFGKRLKSLRLSQNISQAQLAFECDLNVTQVARIERGEVNTSICHVAALAKALGVNSKELFDFEY